MGALNIPWEQCKDPVAMLGVEEVASLKDTILDLDNSWLWRQTQHHLKTGVFHVTGLDWWNEILADKGLKPRTGKSLYTECYGRKYDCICLFDFESSCVETQAYMWGTGIHHCFVRPGTSHFTEDIEVERMIALRCENEIEESLKYHDILIIHWENRDPLNGALKYWKKDDYFLGEQLIPYGIECWHKGPLCLTHATKVYQMNIDNQSLVTYSLAETLSGLTPLPPPQA